MAKASELRFEFVRWLLNNPRVPDSAKEVSLTPNKRGSFGGYGIELDEPLATVLGGREGQKISPSEMTKRLWQYVKRHNLGKKNQ